MALRGYLCECDNPSCRETVWMTHVDFLRAAERGRVLAPLCAEAELIIGRGVGYKIVAGQVAA